jgi:hypothetical protein
VELLAVLRVLLRDRLLRECVDQVDRQRRRHRVPGADRLGEVVAGVEEQDVDPGGRLGREVGECPVCHRRGHHQLVTEGLPRPRQQLLRRGVG